MRRFTLAVLAGLLTVAMAAGPSSAADVPQRPYFTKAPAYYAPVFTWTGFYVGANAGYAWGSSNWGTGNFGTKGWLGGGTLGYNLQSGSFVWGVEGDLDYTTNKGSIAAGTTRNTWLGTARGRIGYAIDRFMPYATAGAAFGGVKMSPAGGGSETDNRFGWAAGAGVEWAFTGAWSTKLEYLYADLGTSNCSAATCGVATSVKFHTSLIRAGVNYRF